MKILVMDDSLSRIYSFTEWVKPLRFDVATSADEALARMSQTKYDWFFLDFDLGADSKNGDYFAREWARMRYPTAPGARVVLHSSSDVGAAIMHSSLRQLGLTLLRQPFYLMDKEIVQKLLDEPIQLA